MKRVLDNCGSACGGEHQQTLKVRKGSSDSKIDFGVLCSMLSSFEQAVESKCWQMTSSVKPELEPSQIEQIVVEPDVESFMQDLEVASSSGSEGLETSAAAVTNTLRSQLVTERLQVSRRIIPISSDDKDGLSLPKAVVVGRAYTERLTDPLKYMHLRDFESTRILEAKKLMSQCGLSEESYNSDLSSSASLSSADITEQLRVIQNVLVSEYQIVVLSPTASEINGFKSNALFKGEVSREKKIWLVYSADQQLFSTITCPRVFFNRSYYCLTCDKAYSDKRMHKCSPACSQSGLTGDQCETSKSPAAWRERKDCLDCRRSFHNQRCFDYHIHSERCKKHFLCRTCNRIVNTIKYSVTSKHRHRCFEKACKPCGGEYFNVREHKCFIEHREQIHMQQMQREADDLRKYHSLQQQQIELSMLPYAATELQNKFFLTQSDGQTTLTKTCSGVS